MTPQGHMIIGQSFIHGSREAIHAVNPVTGERLGPAYPGAGPQEVDRACALAEQAFDAYRETTQEARAEFLEQVSENLADTRLEIVERANLETGLPNPRLEGELTRTINQLRLFARETRSGRCIGATVETALPDRAPLPRPDIRLRYVPLGPALIFGASNFPLAFSVAGGDTASALAAGCPVVVKGHSAHPGTSELVGLCIAKAIKTTGMPEGTFSLLFGSGNEIGASLAADPRIKAIGFTGSRSGGLALMNIAAARAEPIPVYAEMSSVNPVYLLPEALKGRADSIAAGLSNSMLMGSGQFCTNPGLLIARADANLASFSTTLADLVAAAQPSTMLTSDIYQAFESGVARLLKNPHVELLAKAGDKSGPNQCRAHLFATTAQSFLADPSLHDEIFGSCSLIIRCKTNEEMLELTAALDGQLTATVMMDQDDDSSFVRRLLKLLERKVGRILFNGYPTGVEVGHAMVHGGPFPATSNSRTTSVGTEALWRFLRPVCYQNFPHDLLPESLKDGSSTPQRVTF
ncbi:MAG: aldehyde dehydrogenase (NADP(+)) [Betaproteobacteria bacterium]|nr:aldehyde dehydrogenase (NADP(+)) [Betaproteobacteria bacterium]